MRKWRRSGPTTVAVHEIRLCLAADGAETLVIFTGLDLLVCLHDGLVVGGGVSVLMVYQSALASVMGKVGEGMSFDTGDLLQLTGGL